MRCILYGRLALADQVKLGSQVHALREYAQAKGYDQIDVLTDNGYSGMDPDRPGLARARTLAREHQVDVIIARDPDRLTRNLSHQLILVDEFDRAGVRLEFVRTRGQK